MHGARAACRWNEDMGMRMSSEHQYTIFTNVDKTSARLGWISPSTGFTYCGICSRARVMPEIGTECEVCGARVANVLDLSADHGAMQQAWKVAVSAERFAPRELFRLCG